MAAAEHLVRHIDAVRHAAGDTIERRTPRTVNARQAEHPRADRLPRHVRRGARVAAPIADRSRLIDPRPTRIAVNPG